MRLSKPAGLVALGAALAGIAFYGWQRYFSRDADIGAIHAACTSEFADAARRAKSGIDCGRGGEGTLQRRATDAFDRWLDGMTSGTADAVCGTIRDACTSDFEGRICSAARERYR